MWRNIFLCFTLGIAIANQCSGDLKQIFHPPPHKLQVAFASLKQALLADHNCKHKLRYLDCSYWVFSFHLLVQKGVSGTYVISDSPRCFLPPNTQCPISGIPSSPGVSETLCMGACIRGRPRGWGHLLVVWRAASPGVCQARAMCR